MANLRLHLVSFSLRMVGESNFYYEWQSPKALSRNTETTNGRAWVLPPASLPPSQEVEAPGLLDQTAPCLSTHSACGHSRPALTRTFTITLRDPEHQWLFLKVTITAVVTRV